MKFNVVNTLAGLVPETDADLELKKKLKLGNTYEVSIKEVRNPEFNRKFQAMVTLAWDNLPDHMQQLFGNRENFRYLTEVKAGFCEVIYDPVGNFVTYKAKSTAFDKMTETEFEQVYNGVLNVITRDYLPHINKEAFNEQIKWF